MTSIKDQLKAKREVVRYDYSTPHIRNDNLDNNLGHKKDELLMRRVRHTADQEFRIQDEKKVAKDHKVMKEIMGTNVIEDTLKSRHRKSKTCAPEVGLPRTLPPLPQSRSGERKSARSTFPMQRGHSAKQSEVRATLSGDSEATDGSSDSNPKLLQKSLSSALLLKPDSSHDQPRPPLQRGRSAAQLLLNKPRPCTVGRPDSGIEGLEGSRSRHELKKASHIDSLSEEKKQRAERHFKRAVQHRRKAESAKLQRQIDAFNQTQQQFNTGQSKDSSSPDTKEKTGVTLDFLEQVDDIVKSRMSEASSAKSDGKESAKSDGHTSVKSSASSSGKSFSMSKGSSVAKRKTVAFADLDDEDSSGSAKDKVS